MGQVLLARSVGAAGFERLVALKRMSFDLAGSDELIKRFIDEARVAAQVRHANVVPVHHFGRDEHGFYLVLDYIEGASLQTLVDRAREQGTRPAPEVVLRVIADALAGLHAVHEAQDASGRPLGILHRDVSAHNVLIGRDGVSRLTDFGVAKSVINSQQTAQNRLVGKLLYMSPEYLQQQRLDRRLDIYAMGMTMWVALAGVEPWDDVADDTTLVSCILHAELPSLASVGAEVAPELEAIVTKACAKQPADRFATAAEMAGAVNQLSRRTGWMAIHDEVAALIEQFCGRDLVRVREQLANVSSGPRDGSSPLPPNAPKWSSLGAQRIRVGLRGDPAAAEAETVADLSLPASVGPAASGVRARSSASPPEEAGAGPGASYAIAAVILLVVGLVALIAAVIAVLS
jgi:serine/threonine-protein kinase